AEVAERVGEVAREGVEHGRRPLLGGWSWPGTLEPVVEGCGNELANVPRVGAGTASPSNALGEELVQVAGEAVADGTRREDAGEERPEDSRGPRVPGAAHASSSMASRPSQTRSSASRCSASARTPSGVTSTNRLGRPPRTGSGSPMRLTRYPFASSRSSVA